MSRLTRPLFHLTYANVMSSVAVFVALGGTSYAVAQLPKNSVGEKQLRTGAVTSEKIQDGTIARSDLAAGAVASGPRGPRGESGPAGPAGTNGAAGPAGAPGVSAAPEEWKALTLTTGWKSVVEISGGSRQPVQYRRDAFGRVELRGMATYAAGNPANVPVFGQLPAGFRPKAIRAFTVASGGDDSVPGGVNGPAQVNINPDGTLHRMYAATNAEPDWLALDGIKFEVD